MGRPATGEVQRLGRYEIVKHLAYGGMAEVLLGRATGKQGFERHVVIKRIRSDHARDRKFVRMFLEEARLAASLHHQNIVQVMDVGEEGGEYFFAMEYIHGEDLRHILMAASQRQLLVPIEQIVTVIASAAAGLHHAHEQCGSDRTPLGIVHRDVSPANILVGYDGSVKVTDFGIAKAALRSSETRSGTLRGKVSYMSPEQCMGQPADRRSDVYALGIVLYELATVRRLYKSENEFLTMSSIVHGDIPSPRRFRPGLPRGLEEIIVKSLARAPSERYQSADEMRAALEEFAQRYGLRLTGTALAEYLRSLLGEKQDPWLSDSEPSPEAEESPDDFDGEQCGVASLPEEAITHVYAGKSPIANARTKAITEQRLRAENETTKTGEELLAEITRVGGPRGQTAPAEKRAEGTGTGVPVRDGDPAVSGAVPELLLGLRIESDSPGADGADGADEYDAFEQDATDDVGGAGEPGADTIEDQQVVPRAPSAVEPVKPKRRARRGRSAFWVTTGAIVLALGATVGVILMSKSEPAEEPAPAAVHEAEPPGDTGAAATGPEPVKPTKTKPPPAASKKPSTKTGTPDKPDKIAPTKTKPSDGTALKGKPTPKTKPGTTLPTPTPTTKPPTTTKPPPTKPKTDDPKWDPDTLMPK